MDVEEVRFCGFRMDVDVVFYGNKNNQCIINCWQQFINREYEMLYVVIKLLVLSCIFLILNLDVNEYMKFISQVCQFGCFKFFIWFCVMF